MPLSNAPPPHASPPGRSTVRALTSGPQCSATNMCSKRPPPCKDPGSIDELPHRAAFESPLCCLTRRTCLSRSPPLALLSSFPSSKSFPGSRRRLFASPMSCKRFPKAIFSWVAQVSVRYFHLRFRTRRAACPFCSSSARHPFLPRTVLPFSIRHFYTHCFS